MNKALENNILKFLKSNETSLFKFCRQNHLQYKIMKEAILNYEYPYIIKDVSKTSSTLKKHKYNNYNKNNKMMLDERLSINNDESINKVEHSIRITIEI